MVLTRVGEAEDVVLGRELSRRNPHQMYQMCRSNLVGEKCECPLQSKKQSHRQANVTGTPGLKIGNASLPAKEPAVYSPMYRYPIYTQEVPIDNDFMELRTC